MMQEFDDRFRETFSGYSPEVPPHIWENIVAKKKKRRFLFWIWFSQYKYAFVLISIMTAGVLGYLNRDEANNLKKWREARHIDQTPKPLIKNQATELPENSQSSPKDDPAKSALAKDLKIKTMPIEKESTSEHNQTNNRTADFMNTREVNDKSTLQENEETNKSYNTTVKLNTALNSRQKLSSEKPGVLGEKTNRRKSMVSVEEKPDYTISTNRENIPEKFILTERQPARIPTLDLIPFEFKKQEIPCPERNTGSGIKYLEWYAGPDLVFRRLSDTGQSDYLRKRRESASTAFSFSAGVRFTRVFNNGVSLRMGLNYSQINEKFSVQEGNVLQLIYIFNDNGDTVGSYFTRGNLYRTSRNKYHSLDIPLLAGYEFGSGRLRYNINAGVMVNIYSWQRGLVIDTAGKVVNMSTGAAASPYGFKTNAGIGFLASGSIYYMLNDKLYLLAEPYIRYNLSAMNNEELSLRQKFHAAGIRFGIRKDLR